ncbi:MAG: hypothetical protein GX640_15620 [Fibrobacter sp.]|nr:hypothetical protein [Fibrobacter sp.]
MFQKVQFKGVPAVLAAWPGMGNVGLITVDYIRSKLNAQPFAEIDMSPFYIPDSIVVKDGIAKFPEIPTSIFYYTQEPDLIIFESNAQLSGREGILIIRTILDVLTQFPIDRIFTFAAYAQPISYKNDSKIMISCNSSSLLEKIRHDNVLPMPDGYIAGLNGLILGVAASRQIDAACLLGTIPSYAINLNYPKASLAQIEAISSMLNISIDTEEIRDSISDIEQQFIVIEERIREFVPSINKDEDDEISEIEDEKVPHYVMEKIEQLFREAEKNRESATELKRELDRWNLYELYENRFLDLFEDDK